jgi:MGT family glycosyltransferase
VAEAGTLPWAQSIPLFQRMSPGPDVPPVVTQLPFGIAPEPGLAVMNGPRATVGLPALDAPEEIWRAPLHLYYTARPFELDLEFPPSFKFVGPGVWEPPAPEPAWLAKLDRPLIVVSVSSELQPDAKLAQIALDAFRDQNVTLAVSTAAHDPSRFDQPANAHIERWLPHTHLLRHAACVICHGGMGITQKTLAAGVPLCVVPFGRDQFEVGASVAAVAAGTSIPPDALTAGTLRAAVGEAIEMRAGAQAIADAFARAGGSAAAASELESQLVPVVTRA